METWGLLGLNLLSPMVLAFFLGALARGLRSDLAFPEALYTALSLYLLLAIGLKGGVELSKTPWTLLLGPALATLALGLIRPLSGYLLARRFLEVGRADAGALAAHYGSVSAVTFLAALTFAQGVGHRPEGFMPALVALLEVPGIAVALLLAKGRGGRVGKALGEVFTGKSVVLLLGGLCIGALSGERGMERVGAFFVDPFYGVLTLFLLDLGMVAASRLGVLRRFGLRLVLYGVFLPLAHGALGVYLGHLAELSVGGLPPSGPWLQAPPTSQPPRPCAWPCRRPTLAFTSRLA